MAAYNWILFTDRCPSCGDFCDFRAQTHVASDYDGDETGRFHDRTYALGESMRWWPTEDPRHSAWKQGTVRTGSLPEDEDEEACYTTCPSCGKELFAVIRFRRHAAQQILRIGDTENWPADHYR